MHMKSTRGPIDVRVLQDSCTGISNLDFSASRTASPLKQGQFSRSPARVNIIFCTTYSKIARQFFRVLSYFCCL